MLRVAPKYADDRTPDLFLDPPTRTLDQMRKPTSRSYPGSGRVLSRRECLAASLGAAAASTFPARGQSHGRNVPWLSQVQSPSMEGQTPLGSALKRGDGSLVGSLDEWRQRRDEIRRSWLDYLGPLPQNPNLPRLETIRERAASNGTGPIQSPPGVIRELVEYESEPGLRVRGYLIKPRKLSGRAPGIVVLHATTHNSIRQPAGVEGKNQLALGLKLAQQGFVTFSPACLLWENIDNNALPPFCQEQHSGSRADPHGIGAHFSNWYASWYLGPKIKQFGHDHQEVMALIAPRPFLLLAGEGTDGVKSSPFIHATMPAYRLYGDPARLGLLNHGHGHSIPPTVELRINEWFKTYL